MNLFLRAKHWQLFFIMFGVPFLLQIIMMGIIFSKITQNPDPSIVLNYFKLFPLILIVFMAAIYGWQWSVAIGLQKFVPPGIKMKVTKFKVFFIIPIVYLTLIFIGIMFLFNIQFLKGENPPVAGIMTAFLIIFPVHLFSMFCLFYCLYFTAKTYKTVELQREVAFSDFVGEFFLVWFYPVGVWIIQPKINKIVAQPEALATND